MNSLALLLLLAGIPSADAHSAHNPLFRQLLEEGCAVSQEVRVKLPMPTGVDGLDSADVRRRLEALPGRRVAVDRLLRKSIVAPFVYEIEKMDMANTADIAGTVYRIDVVFVAYGSLDRFDERNFADEMLDRAERESSVEILSAETLDDRGIQPLATKNASEHFARTEFALLDRVQIAATVRAVGSMNADSVVVAHGIDRRFTDGAAQPNQWRPILKKPTASAKYGHAKPYDASAGYLKLTRLEDPADALLVEYHLVYVEPQEWFGGVNRLRSKLPILIQSRVRDFRRRLRKMSRTES